MCYKDAYQMLLRLVRPLKRPGSSMPYFVQRIPADVKARAIGLALAIPIGDHIHPVTITPATRAIRISLRTRDPAETKIRQAHAAAYVETLWQALRRDRPISLTHRQATALAGELYERWATSGGWAYGVTYSRDGGGKLSPKLLYATAEEEQRDFAAALARYATIPEDRLAGC
jgi:hypothetical protein